jgi:peptidoglycan/LPS O-acetylase OafA/YrhL
MSRANLTSIEAGRGVAALLVVAYHAGAIVVGPRGGRPPRLFGFGYAGVDFFFVLSGFLITFIHARDFGQPGRVWGYARKRLVRILPTYWLVMALLIPALFLFPALSADKPEKRDPLFILQSHLLLPQREPPVLGVSWTLTYEMAFYALIAATIVSVRLGAALMVAWAAMIAAGTFVDFPFPLSFLAFPRAAEFFLGMAVASLVRWEQRPGFFARHAVAMFGGGVAAFAAAGLFEVYGGLVTTHVYWPLVYGAAAASALLGAVLLEMGPGARAAPSPLVVLGAASYAVYLVHYPALLLFQRVALKAGLHDRLPVGAVFAAAVAAAPLLGVGLHYVAERPLLGKLSARAGASPSVPAGARAVARQR